MHYKIFTKEKFLYYVNLWLPFLLWCFIIFFLSGIPNLKIRQLGLFDLILRKLGHFIEYSILSTLFIRALRGTHIKRILTNRILFWGAFFSIIYAITDEYHQFYVPGRYPAFTDVLIDSTGVIGGSFLYYSYCRKR